MTNEIKMSLQLFAKTKIENVIVPDVFNDYVVEQTAKKSALYQSGIIENNPQFDALAASGGRLLNMPFWADLDGDDEVLKDDDALDVDKIEGKKDVAALLMRGKAWSVNDLAEALSGDDPMGAIADLVANYWQRRWQKILVSTLKGVFSESTVADHNNLDESSNEIDGEMALDGVQLLGENKDRLTGWMMHSAVENKLAKNDLIDYIQPSEGNPLVRTFMGKPVIVDDDCPYTGSSPDRVFQTFAFGEGAIALGEGGAKVPTEVDRDSLAGDDILINRRHFILHPRGVKFTDDDVSDESPTNTELENADNWERVYEPQNVRIVRIEHKI